MTIRHISYLVQNIQVHLKNPPLTLGRTRRELEPTALVWGEYAEAVSRSTAESITVSWDENGIVRPHIVVTKGVGI